MAADDQEPSHHAPTDAVGADRPLTVRLRGGAGNQLFQWAAARSLAGPESIRAIRSTTDDQLAIELLLPGVLQFTESPPTTLWDRLLARRGRLTRITGLFRPLGRRHLYSQRGRLPWAYEPRPRWFVRPELLDGYFQHPSWLQPGGSDVVEELLGHAPSGLESLRALPPYAAICTRRGDYESLGLTLPQDYYDHAVALLPSSLPLVLVGDDPAYLASLAIRLRAIGREVVQPPPVADDPAVNDFWLTVAASSVVMANSTFCWWATTTGDHACDDTTRRTVIFPARWLGGHGTELCAPAWVSVPS